MTEEYVLDESKLCIKIEAEKRQSYGDGFVFIYTHDKKFTGGAFIPKQNPFFFAKKLSLSERCELAVTEAKDDIRKRVKKHNELAYIKDKYETCKEKDTAPIDKIRQACSVCGGFTDPEGTYCAWCGSKKETSS